MDNNLTITGQDIINEAKNALKTIEIPERFNDAVEKVTGQMETMWKGFSIVVWLPDELLKTFEKEEIFEIYKRRLFENLVMYFQLIISSTYKGIGKRIFNELAKSIIAISFSSMEGRLDF